METREQQRLLSIDELNKMKPLEVIQDDRVRDRCVSLHARLHGKDPDESSLFHEKETFNLRRIIQSSPGLSSCTGFSTYGVLCDIMNMGITLDNTTRPLLYVLSRGNSAYVEISPYGELALRVKAGQLLYADRPVVVYEGDEFRPMINDRGQKVVRYSATIPRASGKIAGAFIKLVRPDQSFDYSWMLPEDIDRLAGYSSKQNKRTGKANDLYTCNDGQVDTGFLEAKILKHSLKTFPPLRLGQFSTLSTDEASASDYGLDAPVPVQVPVDERERDSENREQEQPLPAGGLRVIDPDDSF